MACAAPQAPSARPRPASCPSGRVIAAVRVATAKSPPPKPMPGGAGEEQRGGAHRGGEDHRAKRPRPRPAGRARPCGRGRCPWPASAPASAKPTSAPAAQVAVSKRGGRDRQAEDLAAIGFQQHVLHVEGHRAQEHHDQKPPGVAAAGIDRPRRRGSAGAVGLALGLGHRAHAFPASTGRSRSGPA